MDSDELIIMFAVWRQQRNAATERHRCIPPDLGCGRQITDDELTSWPQVNVNEYKISGWCKDCQDRIFTDPESAEPTPEEAPTMSLVDGNGRRQKPQRQFRTIAEPDGSLPYNAPENITGQVVADEIGDIEIITSEAADRLSELAYHYPAIDVDVPVYVVPSNGPHKYALYIDHPVPEVQYFALLDALAEAGIVERGYAEVSRKRGYSAVRPPWVNKPDPGELF